VLNQFGVQVGGRLERSVVAELRLREFEFKEMESARQAGYCVGHRFLSLAVWHWDALLDCSGLSKHEEGTISGICGIPICESMCTSSLLLAM
jgi:hypothetical protein